MALVNIINELFNETLLKLWTFIFKYRVDDNFKNFQIEFSAGIVEYGCGRWSKHSHFLELLI